MNPVWYRTWMPESLIVKFPTPQEGELTTTRNVEIALNIDGAVHKLTRVRRVAIVADSEDELLEVNLTMYSPTFDEDIFITREHAEAIRNHQTDQGLSFLTADDRKYLRGLRAGIGAAIASGSRGFEDGAAVLDKLIAEFDRIDSELADTPW